MNSETANIKITNVKATNVQHVVTGIMNAQMSVEIFLKARWSKL